LWNDAHCPLIYSELTNRNSNKEVINFLKKLNTVTINGQLTFVVRYLDDHEMDKIIGGRLLETNIYDSTKY
jgi:hypothetical protein